MPAPNNRNWKAMELPDFAGHKYEIIVTGEVETPSSNLLPMLRERVPQGFNPRILMLDLTIEPTGGIGTPAFAYRKAEYRRPTSGHAYDEVEIFFDGVQIARVKVEHPKSLVGVSGGKLAAKKSAKKSAKKTAKKKPAKKKTAKKKTAKNKKVKKAGRKKRL